MHRITKVLYSGAIACSIVAGAVGSASAVGTGNEGCTPGYWKNHVSAWDEYEPTDTAGSVFVALTSTAGQKNYPGLADKTLLQSLQGGGDSTLSGAATILLRAATAAVLNAAEDDFGYPRTRFASDDDPTGIIPDVNAALRNGNRSQMLNLARSLDRLNNLGCPL